MEALPTLARPTFDAGALFEHACAMGLEGIVAKNAEFEAHRSDFPSD